MTDRIALSGITVVAHHGVFLEERERGQPFVVDVVAHLDLHPAGRSDDLADTVDYGDLAVRIHDLVAGERHHLIERVAERVAELVLTDPRVEEVEVTVHKPEAPIPVPTGSVSVTVRRGR